MNSLLARRSLQVTTGVLAGLAVVSLIYLGVPGMPGAVTGPPETLPGSPVLEPYPAPPFSLVTTGGESFTGDDLHGQVSLVFFGFANCPDVCPLTLTKMSRALEILESRGLGFQGIFVSVDPARDTPEALERYMKAFHPSLVALTGDEAEVHRMAGEWGIHVTIHDGFPDALSGHVGHEGSGGNDDGYAVEHSTRALVVDSHGRVVNALASFLTAEELAEALETHLVDGESRARGQRGPAGGREG